MHALQVFDFEGRHAASTPAELADVIERRFDEGNHFMIAAMDADYPPLDVMVRDQYAMVHYFRVAGVAGDQAIGNLSTAPDQVEFPENRAGAVIQMPGSVVIDTDTATRCVEQFAETLTRPTLVAWLEL